ncbi:MAG: hypothetical protein ACOC80_16715 [Petrotogales bacterium]
MDEVNLYVVDFVYEGETYYATILPSLNRVDITKRIDGDKQIIWESDTEPDYTFEEFEKAESGIVEAAYSKFTAELMAYNMSE